MNGIFLVNNFTIIAINKKLIKPDSFDLINYGYFINFSSIVTHTHGR
jgi:hypothetical protein